MSPGRLGKWDPNVPCSGFLLQMEDFRSWLSLGTPEAADELQLLLLQKQTFGNGGNSKKLPRETFICIIFDLSVSERKKMEKITSYVGFGGETVNLD